MDMKNQLDRIEDKLDKVDVKLDNYQNRISKTEVSIEFMKGHLRWTLSIAMTVIAGLTAYLFNQL